MENIQQPKKSKKMFIYIVLTTIVGLCVFGVGVFYFYPAPDFIQNKGEKLAIQRCFYNGGISYSVPPEYDDGFSKLYDARGNVECVSGGISGKKSTDSCSNLLCFPFYR